MNAHTPRPVAGLVVGALACLSAGVLLVNDAGADTTVQTVNVTTNSPLTGLVDGSVIVIHAATSAPNQVTLIQARICQPGAEIDEEIEFRPSKGGMCADDPLSTGTDYNVIVPTDAPNLAGDLTFKVGVGTDVIESFLDADPPEEITCGPDHPCRLVVRTAVPGVAGDPNDPLDEFYHFDLSFAGGTGTSSTSSSSTSSSSTSSSSTSSSSTSSSSTSSSSTSSSSTSSTSSSTTSTTQAGGSTTSTTLQPGAPTLTPSTIAPGGQVTIDSTGWQASSNVLVVLHSDPVTIATLVADANGKVSGKATIPAATPAGAHEIELAGKATDGSTRSVRAPLTVGAQSGSTTSTAGGSSSTSTTRANSTSIPRTGQEVGRLVWAGLAFAVAGGLLVTAGVRRRRALQG